MILSTDSAPQHFCSKLLTDSDVMQLTLHQVRQIKFSKFKMTISFLMETGAGGSSGQNSSGTIKKPKLFEICC